MYRPLSEYKKSMKYLIKDENLTNYSTNENGKYYIYPSQKYIPKLWHLNLQRYLLHEDKRLAELYILNDINYRRYIYKFYLPRGFFLTIDKIREIKIREILYL